MQKIILALALMAFTYLSVSAQTDSNGDSNFITKKVYISQENEMIFSFADIDVEGANVENVMRWSPVFNLMGHVNYDLSKNFGLNIGLGFRNVGFIADFPNELDENGEEADIKRKFRTYNLGLPIGFKIGNLNQRKPLFLFGGYEFELPFHYKEKYFVDGDKEKKRTAYFSDKVEPFVQSVYAGVQLPQGFSLKFKYYLTGFFNQDYEDFGTLDADGNPIKPYDGFNVNVFYFSINWFPFQSTKLLYDLD